MGSDNLKELNLKKSLDVLNRFHEDVENKNRNKNVINEKLFGAANKALINQGKFAELMDSINPQIFDKAEHYEAYEVFCNKDKRKLKFHDSLKVLIYFYKEVAKTEFFTKEELGQVWKALKHQFNVNTRLSNIGFDIHKEGRCSRRPRSYVVLPDEPV